MVNETEHRNRILDMYKFRIRFRLVHCGTITSVTCYGFRQILHASQKCDGFYVRCFGNHKSEVSLPTYRVTRPIELVFTHIMYIKIP